MTDIKARAYQVREVEATDTVADGHPRQLHLGDLRELVKAADKEGLADDATLYASRCSQASNQPDRLFIGTLVVQDVGRE